MVAVHIIAQEYLLAIDGEGEVPSIPYSEAPGHRRDLSGYIRLADGAELDIKAARRRILLGVQREVASRHDYAQSECGL